MKVTESLNIPPKCLEKCANVCAIVNASSRLQDVADMKTADALHPETTAYIVEEMSAVREQAGEPPITAAEYRQQVAADLEDIDAKQDELLAEARALVEQCRAGAPLEVMAHQFGRGVLVTICNSGYLPTGGNIEAVPVVRYEIPER